MFVLRNGGLTRSASSSERFVTHADVCFTKWRYCRGAILGYAVVTHADVCFTKWRLTAAFNVLRDLLVTHADVCIDLFQIKLKVN